MKPHESDEASKRFREISETCSSIEHSKQFALRFLDGLIRYGVFPRTLVPSAIKNQLAQLSPPHKNEASALEKLSRTLFGRFLPKLFWSPESKTKAYIAGFVSGALLRLERIINAPYWTTEERAALQSFLSPSLCAAHIAHGRLLYDIAPRLPYNQRDEFYDGLKRGSIFGGLGCDTLSSGSDSTKTYFAIAILGKNNRLLRSSAELFRFINETAVFKLRLNSDSFKKTCQYISWHGARLLRSMRTRKSGVWS